MRRRALSLAVLIVLAVASSAVGLLSPPAVAQPSTRLSVVTSTTVFVDLIRQVGGPQVDAFSIVPPGADVHTFQPTPRDLQRAAAAHLAVWNGLGLDDLPRQMVASVAGARMATVTLTEGLEPIPNGADADSEGQGEHTAGNPHMWLDPTLAQRYVERIRDALEAIDPAGAAIYHANADRYLAEIADLDAWAARELATIPPERRKLVTFHDAFPYLARRYGFEVIGVVVRGPGREPSAQEVAELVSELRAFQVPAVYAEPQLNARVLELAARDSGVQLRTLYSDALDESVSTYLDLMRYNVRSLVEGLR